LFPLCFANGAKYEPTPREKLIFIAAPFGKFIWERFKQFMQKYLIFRSIFRHAVIKVMHDKGRSFST